MNNTRGMSERSGAISARPLVEASKERRAPSQAEHNAAVDALQDARLGVCRMDGPNGPECWCGSPSTYESGECEYHGAQAQRALQCDRAERERDEALGARLLAEQRLEATEERGRLIGEWNGALVHTDGMVALFERLARVSASPDMLRKEAALLRSHATYLRSRPPRPSPFSDSDELRELRRTEADAAVALLRHRESHPFDDDGIKRLHQLWANAAARVNSMEAKARGV